jgi:glycosyltransferase involved in cell wall biosynthesis
MHVLMTVDPLGGVFTYARELSKWLDSEGVRTTWVSFGAPLSSEQRRQTEDIELYESALRLEWMDDPWDDVAQAGDWLLQIERHVRPDIVHLNGYAHAALPWRAPTVVVAHSSVCTWWRAVHGEPAPERYGRYREAVQKGLGAASLIVAPTAAMLAALANEYGPLGPTRVIYNGVDESPDSFHRESFVLAAGRVWDPAKNIATLDRAAAAVPWPIYVAGDARGPGEREASTLENLRLLGTLQHHMLASWMRRAAIFVSPALYEPFGLAVLEAALTGSALVLADIASFRELWDGAAEFVDARDANALGRAIRRLIFEPARRQALGESALCRARRYGAERMGSRYLESYRSLLRRDVAPARELRA